MKHQGEGGEGVWLIEGIVWHVGVKGIFSNGYFDVEEIFNKIWCYLIFYLVMF